VDDLTMMEFNIDKILYCRGDESIKRIRIRNKNDNLSRNTDTDSK